MLKRILLLVGMVLSLFLIWFAVGTYRWSLPIAEENLRGISLSLATAVENIAVRDPSFRSLAAFHPSDIAYLAVIDREGIYRFHTNPDLVGTRTESDTYLRALSGRTVPGRRMRIASGEQAWEIYIPLYLSGDTYVLRLDLHTDRADAVVRYARFNMAVLLALLLAGWSLGLVLYRYAVREERRQEEMGRRERLARIGEMGAMLAHEIRNPLAGIKGFAQVIEKRPDALRNAGFAQRIVAEVLRLERLVNDLLLYARNETYPMSSVDLPRLIDDTVSLIREEAEQQHVTVSAVCGTEQPVLGNRDRLGQVLLNLMKNSVQAMPEGGTLLVTVLDSASGVIVRVTDTGEGIDAGDMARVFDPFFTTKARGTGIGLALCRKIVEEHGGKIAVESSAGAGTSVSVALPKYGARKRTGW
jgi:two-component system sensor histidine kinase HydH